jgi:dihydroorotate dehydrogenase (NAD+) catalytic subunit
MANIIQAPFYDPLKTFEENFDNGPFDDLQKAKPLKTKDSPKYTFLGYKVNFPFGIAAGSLPTSKHIKAAFNMGFDIATYKTQRTTIIPANQFPNVIPIDVKGDVTLEKADKGLRMADTFNEDYRKLTITNSFGNPSRGPKFWVKDVKKALKHESKGQLLVVSVCGTIVENQTDEEYYQDFADAAKLAAGTGVKAVELNLSCPNAANEGVICYTYDAVMEIVKKTRKAIDKKTKLILKFGYFTNKQQKTLEKIVDGVAPMIDAISLINTIPAAIYKKDGTQALPGEGRLKSGLCGVGIKWAGIDMVKRLNKLRNKKGYKFEIIGVGGVMAFRDFEDYRKAGADVVMSVTASMWNPHLAQEIKEKYNK